MASPSPASSSQARVLTQEKPALPRLLSLPTPQAFLDLYWVRDGEVGFFIPDGHDLQVGQELEVELAFSTPPMHFRTRGVIRWRRVKGGPGLPAGAGFAFPVQERATLDVILNFVHGTSLRGVADRKPRLPAALGVTFVANGQVQQARIENISATGIFVAAPNLPERGVLVTMNIDTPTRGRRIDLDGVVVWQRASGLVPGFGVRFLGRSSGTQHEIAQLLRALAQDAAARRARKAQS